MIQFDKYFLKGLKPPTSICYFKSWGFVIQFDDLRTHFSGWNHQLVFGSKWWSMWSVSDGTPGDTALDSH